MLSQSKIKKLYLSQICFSVLGLAASVYLLIQHTRLKSGIQDHASFCSLGKYADCDVVSASRYAELFGIPLGMFGALFFFAVIALAVMSPPKDKSFRFIQWVMACLVTLGVVFESYFALIVQTFILKTFCLFCCIVYACAIAVLVSLFKVAEKGTFLKFDREWTRPVWVSTKVIVTAVCFLMFLGLMALLPSFIRQKSSSYQFVDNAMDQFYLHWKDKPIRKMEITEGNGTFGNPAAKVQIVEFSDFECPYCKRAAFTLHTVFKPLKDKVHFIFKNFPLDSSCNPDVPYQMHAHACKLARLSNCAEKKGIFWEFHDHVFFNLNEDKMREGWDAIAETLGNLFTKEEITQCLSNPKSLEGIARDMHMGHDLNVRATPTLYINGKIVSPLPITIETVRKLVEMEESLAK